MHSMKNSDIEINWLLVLLPFLFALFLFALTRFVDFLKSQYRIKNEVIRNQLYFSIWIGFIEPQIQKQNERLRILVEQVQNDTFENLIQINLHIDKLKEVSSKERLNAFYTNRKGNKEDKIKSYYALEHLTDYLQGKQKHLEHVFEINKKALFEISDQWNVEMHRFNDLIGRLIMENHKEVAPNVLINQLINVVSDNKFNTSTKIPNLIEGLIRPTTEIVSKFYETIPKDELFYSLGETVRKLYLCSHKYLSFKTTAISNFSTLSDELTTAMEKLKQAASKANGYELKPVFLLK